ncbi:hypothetical protein [Streptomyces sp. NPDC088726]|uniref:hypothetical protein n=1 Tax=Streptomyces sp. NPDC088726 TaxID=3365874 RepID=UPI003814D292
MSQDVSPISPDRALEASDALVSRRRGVPKLVSLRAAAAPGPLGADDGRAAAGHAASPADDELASAFTAYHTDLGPSPDGEPAVIRTLQALAYATPGPDRAAAPPAPEDERNPSPARPLSTARRSTPPKPGRTCARGSSCAW